MIRLVTAALEQTTEPDEFSIRPYEKEGHIVVEALGENDTQFKCRIEFELYDEEL